MSGITRVLTWATAIVVRHPLEIVGTYALLANPLTRTWTVRMMGATGRGALTAARTSAVITSEELLVPALSHKAATTTAAVGLAAVSGAVVGTAISQSIWGEQGARDALTFYGFDAGQGEAHYWGTKQDPGYFNVPGNVSKIWKHYT